MQILERILLMSPVVCLLSCSNYDTTGGDFNKERVAAVAESYRQGAEAPRSIVDSLLPQVSQAQSTTFWRLRLTEDLVQEGQQLAFLIEQQQGFTSRFEATEGEGFQLVRSDNDSWLLTLYPGMAPLLGLTQEGENASKIVVTEPQVADSGESIVVTRTSDTSVVLQDFEFSAPAMAATTIPVTEGLTGWPSYLIHPVASAQGDGSDFLDSEVASILYEPRAAR